MPTNLPSAPVGWVIVAVACQVAFVVLAVLTVRIDRAAKTRPLRVKSSHGESEAGFYQRMATDSRVLGHQWAKLGQSDLADMHERIAVTYQHLVEAARNGDDPPTSKPTVRQCIVCNVDSTKQLFWRNDTLCLACGANAEADKVEAENAAQKARNAALKERLADNKRRVAEQSNGSIDQARARLAAAEGRIDLPEPANCHVHDGLCLNCPHPIHRTGCTTPGCWERAAKEHTRRLNAKAAANEALNRRFEAEVARIETQCGQAEADNARIARKVSDLRARSEETDWARFDGRPYDMLSKSVPVIQGPVCGPECSCHWSAEKRAEMKNRDADV